VAKLVLVRDHPNDIAHRYALMSVDGQQVARLKYKDRVEIEVPAGRHTLEGKNELGKANTFEFEAREGETVTVHVGGVPIGCFSLFAGIVPPTPDIVMQLAPWEGTGGAKWK
jgi:hypothetical protein